MHACTLPRLSEVPQALLLKQLQCWSDVMPLFVIWRKMVGGQKRNQRRRLRDSKVRDRSGWGGGGTEINFSSTWYNRKIICMATYLNASGSNVLLLGQLKCAVLFHGWLKCAVLCHGWLKCAVLCHGWLKCAVLCHGWLKRALFLWLSDGLLARSDSTGENANSTISMFSSASLAPGQL